MAVRAHVTQLTMKHAKLDQEILDEMKRTRPDTLRLSELKRETVSYTHLTLPTTPYV